MTRAPVRLAYRTRGFDTLQAVLLLGAAFFVVMALKNLTAADAKPAVEAGTAEVFSPTVKPQSVGAGPAAVAPTANPTPAPVPTPTPESEVGSGSSAPAGPTATPAPAPLPTPTPSPEEEAAAAARIARAQAALDKIPEVEKLRDMTNVAYGPDDNPNYAADKKALAEKYDIQEFDLWTGAKFAVFVPKDPLDKNVVLAVAGTDGPSPTDWATNIGQGTPGWLAKLNPFLYGADEFADMNYEGIRSIARVLKEKYGAENVTLAGHSLGAGEAVYAGAMEGLRTVGFNSARLGRDNWDRIRREGVEGAEKYITNVVAAGEPLNEYTPGRYFGDVVMVDSTGDGTFDRHDLGNMILKDPLDYTGPASPWSK